MSVTSEGFRATVETAILKQLDAGKNVELYVGLKPDGTIYSQKAVFIGAAGPGSRVLAEQINDADRSNTLPDAVDQLIQAMGEIKKAGYPTERHDSPTIGRGVLRAFPKGTVPQHG
jgi:hypothetical protein